MFGFRKSKTDAVSGFLGSQTEFTGKLCFSGVVHLDGTFEGEIISRGTLVVGSESVVTAHIYSNILKIAGEVHGDLTASEKIELYPPAKVYGNIRTPSLIVEEGVIFEGTCRMSTLEAQVPEIARHVIESSGETEAIEGILAEAWPPEYEQAEGLEESYVDKAHLHKQGQ
jgi:cytoskeletal protein CcmA (bactofilin family)